MIPAVNDILTADLETIAQPDNTYALDLSLSRINGKKTEIEAVKQSIYKILNTERYQYTIYSWDYGIELTDLYGEPQDYVCPELERRITDALKFDDRILDCNSFEFNTCTKGIVAVSFRVDTIYGDITVLKEVEI